jgi:hypothetical protein
LQQVRPVSQGCFLRPAALRSFSHHDRRCESRQSISVRGAPESVQETRAHGKNIYRPPAIAVARQRRATQHTIVPRYFPLRKRRLPRKLRASATCNGRSPSRPTPHRECWFIDRIQCVPPPSPVLHSRRWPRDTSADPSPDPSFRCQSSGVRSFLDTHSLHAYYNPHTASIDWTLATATARRPLLCIVTDSAPDPRRSLPPCHARTAHSPPTLRKHHWRATSTRLLHTPWTSPRHRPEHRELIHDIAARKVSVLLGNRDPRETERSHLWKKRGRRREPP